MRIRLAALAALTAAIFPAQALADDPPPPDQPPADSQPPPPSCLAAKGQVDGISIRGVRPGVRANIRDSNGNPVSVRSVSYCVDGGGQFGFALDRDANVVLVLSTAAGDAIGRIAPSAPAESARAQFPQMKKLTREGSTSVYRIDPRRQLILGVAAGRVSFVAAADRLLLEYPAKLGYYMHRLGF